MLKLENRLLKIYLIIKVIKLIEITIEGCLSDGINSLGFFKKLSLKFSFCSSFELKSFESFFEKEKIFIILL